MTNAQRFCLAFCTELDRLFGMEYSETHHAHAQIITLALKDGKDIYLDEPGLAETCKFLKVWKTKGALEIYLNG